MKKIIKLFENIIEDKIYKIYRQGLNYSVNQNNKSLEKQLRNNIFDVWQELKPFFVDFLNKRGFNDEDGVRDYLLKYGIDPYTYNIMFERAKTGTERYIILKELVYKINSRLRNINLGKDDLNYLYNLNDDYKDDPDLAEERFLEYFLEKIKNHNRKSPDFNGRFIRKKLKEIFYYLDNSRNYKIPAIKAFDSFDEMFNFTPTGDYSDIILRQNNLFSWSKLKSKINQLEPNVY